MMVIKHGLIAGALSLGLAVMGTAQAATVDLGTYAFDTDALVDQVTGFSGGNGMYNGTSFINPLTTPADLIDSKGWTFVSTMLDPANLSNQNYNGLSLDLGFTKTNVVNGSGADLALFFLFDQAGNDIDVTINGVTRPLSFANLYDSGGTQQIANGVAWMGGTLNNVLVLVSELDLNDFGVAGGALSNSLRVTLNQSVSDPMQVAALSLVGAINSSSSVPPAVIPVPAAVWLFGSGLIGLVGLARRKRR